MQVELATRSQLWALLWTAFGYLVFLVSFFGGVVVIAKLIARGRKRGNDSHAGWFPDPSDPQKLRYWDGNQWTVNTTERQP